MRRSNAARLFCALSIGGSLCWSAQAALADPVTPRQLVEVVDFAPPSLSPDGRWVAFRTEQASIEQNIYRTIWYVQPADASAPPRRLADGGETVKDYGARSAPETAVWSPDGRWIFYRALMEGRIEVWRAAADGSRTEPVVQDPANVRAFSLSPDGGTIRYSVGATREAVIAAEQADYDQGTHIDRSVPLGDYLFRSGIHDGRMATQRLVTDEAVRYPLLFDTPDRWKAADLSSGVVSDLPDNQRPAPPLTASELPFAVGGLIQTADDPDSGRIAVLFSRERREGNTDRPETGLALLASRTMTSPRMCDSKLCVGQRITAVRWRPGTDEVVFTTTDLETGGGQSLLRWNVVTGEVSPIVRSQGQLGDGVRYGPGPCAVSSAVVACVAADADRPPRLERIDLETGERTLLFDPNAALARQMAATPVRLLSWTDADGEAYTGFFYPAATSEGAPSPLFVSYYRCSGYLRGGVGDEWPFATLAAEGVAALCVNSPPMSDDAVERYQQGLNSIQQVVDMLAGEGAVDPTRVGMGGLSFGAEVSMWVAMHSDLAQAVSLSTPVVSPMMRLIFSPWEEQHFARLRRYWQLGTPAETPELWRRYSPAYDIHSVRAPVLMQFSEQEWRTSFDYSIPMIRAGLADAYVFPHEQHQKAQPRHKLAVYERNLDWFRFWLQDFEDADPEKADQYRRWREMRDARTVAGP